MLSAADAKVNVSQGCPQDLSETDEMALGKPKPSTHPPTKGQNYAGSRCGLAMSARPENSHLPPGPLLFH